MSDSQHESDEAWMARVYPHHAWTPDDGIPYATWCRHARGQWEAEHAALKDEVARLRAALLHERDCQWCGNGCPDRHSECEGCTLAAALGPRQQALTEGQPTYPCEKCGKLRTKAEGGTTFTVCDDCWNEAYAGIPLTKREAE